MTYSPVVLLKITFGRSMLAVASSGLVAWVSTCLRNSHVLRSLDRYTET